MNTYAILTDVTRCIGCEQCIRACKTVNETGKNDAPFKWQGPATDLSSNRWTALIRTREGRYVRVLCRHCLSPGCVAACPVGALERTDEGAVTYDPSICLGCRYCMMACPFRIPRYEWESPTPRVRKCILCYDNITSGELEQPACTAACPTHATIFGEREALLTEAKRRIKKWPERYIDHVWGEQEVGGTSVLVISDVDLADAGWPSHLTSKPVGELAKTILGTVPGTFVSVGAVMFGLNWIIKRRQKLALEAVLAAKSGSEDDEGDQDG